VFDKNVSNGKMSYVTIVDLAEIGIGTYFYSTPLFKNCTDLKANLSY